MESIKYLNISLEVFGGILSLVIIVSLILTSYENNDLNRGFIRILVCNILVLGCDAAAWHFKGGSEPIDYYAVRICNFGVFVFGYLLLALFTDYLVGYLALKANISKRPAKIMWSLTVFAILLVIISQFNHMYYRITPDNLYQRGEWFWLSQVWAIACMLINSTLLIRCRKKLHPREFLSFSTYIFLPILAMVIQVFVYGIALLYLSTSISVLCIYMGIQVDQARLYREKELELERSRTEIMLSQIQPHFIFNSLTSICCLCRTDPVKAEKAVLSFSSFLRGNLESLNTLKLIPFTQELRHLRCYLEMEKIRFGDRLNVVYDIKAEGFLLPSLTVQPIAENAVRHGVEKKSAGGTVTITAEEGFDSFVVTVTDDGVGFLPSDKAEDGRVHIGIQNVRQRLQRQCGGTLVVSSVPDKGTRVTINIPKSKRPNLKS